MGDSLVNVADAKTKFKKLFIQDKANELSRIKAIASFKCKNEIGGCLQMCMSLDECITCITPIRRMFDRMSRAEKDGYLRDYIRHCVIINPKKKKAICNWQIGEAPGKVITGICRYCFGNVYGVSKNKLVKFVREIKNKVLAPQFKRFGDKSKPPDASMLTNIQNHLQAMTGHTLTRYQTMSLFCPDNHLSRATCTWMYRYFGLIGDYQPTKEEIHLEPITKGEVNNTIIIIY